MKRLLFLVALACASYAPRSYAVSCQIPNNSSTATIQAALNAAASNSCSTSPANTVSFVAGNSNVSGLNVPCPGSAGMVITGPATGYPQAWNARPTATLTNNVTGEAGQLLSLNVCSNPVTITYLEIDGNHPTTGGGSIDIPTGNSGLVTIRYNYFHGIQEIVPTVGGSPGNKFLNYDDFNADMILVEGFPGAPVTSNIDIEYNVFGNPANIGNNDCSNIMNFVGENVTQGCTNQSTGAVEDCFIGYNSSGGSCNALGMEGNITNLNFNYNIVSNIEQGLKGYEGGTDKDADFYHLINVNFKYNDISFIHRIFHESQMSPETQSQPFTWQYNDVHDPVDASFGTWMLSAPQLTYSLEDDNVMISNGSSAGPANFEYWGNLENNHNLEQGNIGCGSDVGYGTSSSNQISYNIFQLNNTGGCSMTNSSGFTQPGVQPEYSPDEGIPVSNYPQLTGNTFTTTISTLRSVAPTISPSGGSFSGSQTITFTDLGNNSNTTAGPRNNTGIWCTTDGSNPVPKTGTVKYYNSGDTLTITQTTTVICVGMWGAITQPGSYPSGYGYVPSNPVTANFTGSGGTPTVNAPTLTPGSQTFGSSLSVSASTSTGGATIRCTTDGSTPTTSSPVYSGPFTFTSTTTLTCFATESGFNNSSPTQAQYTYSLFLGNNNLDVDGTTYPNAANSVYSITGTSAGGYTANSATLCMTNDVVTNGASTDVVVSTATSSTTQNTSPKCTATYTNTSAAGPGCVTIPISGCGTFAASTAYFISAITNDPLTPSPMGFWDCGGACGATAPTSGGTGTYYGLAYAISYGGPYTLPGTLGVTDSNQPTIYLNLSAQTNPMAATPVISPTSTTFTGTESVSISDTTPGAVIHYTIDGSTPTSSSPTYTATLSLTSTTTVNAIAVATSFTNSSQATATYTLTSASLSSVYLGTPNNANYTSIPGTIQFNAYTIYTDGFQSTLICAGSGCADSRGTYVSSWTTTAPSVATIASSGILTPVALGSTNIQAQITYTGGTTSSSPWTEYVSKSSNTQSLGVTMKGVTVR